MDKKEQARLRMKKMRERNKDSVTEESVTGYSVTDPMLYPDGTRALIFEPSKFLSPEEDRKVQENVVSTMKGISGSRLRFFRGLGTTFTPNKLKDPSLVTPELT